MNWPHHKPLTLSIPSTLSGILEDAVLRISVSHGIRVPKKVGSADYSLRGLLMERRKHPRGRPLSECDVTLSLEKDGRPTRAFVSFAVGLGHRVTCASGRSFPVNSYSKSPGDTSILTPKNIGIVDDVHSSHEAQHARRVAHAWPSHVLDSNGTNNFADTALALDAEWQNAGESSALRKAAVTVNISDVELLDTSLQIEVCNKNMQRPDTTVGKASCILDKVVNAMHAGRPECRFPSVGIEQNKNNVVKKISFTAWLERNRYFSVGVHNVQIAWWPGKQLNKRNHGAAVSYLCFKLGGSTLRKTRTTDTHLSADAYLPATAGVLEHCLLYVELWHSDAVSEVLVAVASTAVKCLTSLEAPICFTLPLLRRGLQESDGEGLISLTLTCTELTHEVTKAGISVARDSSGPSNLFKVPQIQLQGAELCLRALRFRRASSPPTRLYCTTQVGRIFRRTSIKSVSCATCDWPNEALVFHTSFNVLMGKFLQMQIWSRANGSPDSLVGHAKLHLTPARCMLHCSHRAIVRTSPSEPVCVQLRQALGAPCGVISFELEIIAEDDSAITEIRCFQNNSVSSSAFRIGHITFASMNHLNDDELCSSPLEQDATDSITPSTMDGAQFLVGAFDDNRCDKKDPRDRNELRLILLRTRGLRVLGRSHPHDDKVSGLQIRSLLGAAPLSRSMARPGIVSAHMVAKNAKVGIRSMNGVGEQEYSYKSIDVAELEQELGEQFILPASDVDFKPLGLELVVQGSHKISSERVMGRSFIELSENALPGFGVGLAYRFWLQLGGNLGSGSRACKVRMCAQ